MREFNLDLLIGKEVVVNCKTEKEAEEFLKYLDSKNIKWSNGCDIFKTNEYYFNKYKENTCFAFEITKGLIFSRLFFFKRNNYEIIPLDDLAIKPKNNFKDYGFEADFEGEILSDIEDYYIGYYIEKYPCITEKQKIPTFWNKNTGNCYKGAGVSNSKYSLKPIKKEWFENPDNFPCLVYHIYDNSFHIATDTTIDEDSRLIKIYDKYRPCDVFRPATKEEALSLLVKE